MYVIRLPDGTLRVPTSATTDDGRIIGQGYVEVGPGDPDYDRLLRQSLTEEELEEKRRGWREGDEALLREFEEWKATQAED
ncbi:hypothetical protein SAMN04489712_104279 [Thermomonospora echinospora]|uniref:Uncharacterized protein n=1 Tax=Thermomonospora echinospora TaxID=1992 RepID=A0A1H5Z273_9ACTN|nr:hypothetical protein [Thermomonospora echinospora]SEG29725.1 hypothetical protein SAMN04489712_104279 [Thermomonospora echinospora]